MSLIKDVRDELKIIPSDKKSLRKFGITIGLIFIGISLFLFFRYTIELLSWALLFFGAYLLITGLLAPLILRKVYFLWMTGALVLGWFVSRFILIILFYLIITPIGLLAKLVGKKFLDIKYPDIKDSYWIKKSENHKINYTKMY